MPKKISTIGAACLAAFASVFWGSAAFAQSAPVMGQPLPGQIGLQGTATEMGSRIADLFNLALTPIMVVIALFVTALLIYVMFRFNQRSNPVASTVTHNTTLEVIWIAIPSIIVLGLLVLAWQLIFFIDTQPTRPGLTVTVVGKQWKWGYEYDSYLSADDYAQVALAEMDESFEGDITDIGDYVYLDGFAYDSCSNRGCGVDTVENTLGEGLELAAVDNHMVIPSGTNVAFQVVAEDVGHSFAMPAFGIKMDAWPGRTNYTWANVQTGKEGIYIGQCSEICGEGHAYMPIVIEVVTPAQFDQWIAVAAETVISSGGTQPPPSVQDVLGENYWQTSTAMVSQ